jgi:hypothetical protein
MFRFVHELLLLQVVEGIKKLLVVCAHTDSETNFSDNFTQLFDSVKLQMDASLALVIPQKLIILIGPPTDNIQRDSRSRHRPKNL